jgi:uncharacterized protein YbcI
VAFVGLLHAVCRWTGGLPESGFSLGREYGQEMPDMSDDPRGGPDDAERAAGLLARISTQMVHAMKEYHGKGPISAKSYLIDDLLFVVLREGMTKSEQTMLDAGHENVVRSFRQEFENEMADRLTAMVEELTGRRVINYQSQVMFDPNMSVEMFVFDKPARPGQLQETAEAITDPEVGLARSDELDV